MMFWNSFGRCENKTISILIQNTSEYDFGYVIQSRHTAWHRTEEGKKDMHKSKHISRIGFDVVYVLIEQSHYMEDAHFRVVWVMNMSIGGNYTFFTIDVDFFGKIGIFVGKKCKKNVFKKKLEKLLKNCQKNVQKIVRKKVFLVKNHTNFANTQK